MGSASWCTRSRLYVRASSRCARACKSEQSTTAYCCASNVTTKCDAIISTRKPQSIPRARRMRNAPTVLLGLAIVALIMQNRDRLSSTIFRISSTSPQPKPQLQLLQEAVSSLPSSPPPPSPPPSTLALAIANRVAASIAAEAAEDLKADFSTVCNPSPHAGFSGNAFTWGLTFKVESPKECCSACHAHQRVCGPDTVGQVYHSRRWQGLESPARCLPMPGSQRLVTSCNVWLFCGEPRCWSSDKWNHSFGECEHARTRTKTPNVERW